MVTSSIAAPASMADRILDAALALAERHGWEAVRLEDVAREADVSLDDIREHFREKEALTEAWFDRADATMLRAAEAQGFAQLHPRARLHRLIDAWLDALAAHPGVTRQMILNKLEPGHLHVQIPALLRISRTVQWLREAAGRRATYVARALEESALTSVFVATFVHWLTDGSPDRERTRRLLHRLLGALPWLSWAPGPREAPARAPGATAPRPR